VVHQAKLQGECHFAGFETAQVDQTSTVDVSKVVPAKIVLAIALKHRRQRKRPTPSRPTSPVRAWSPVIDSQVRRRHADERPRLHADGCTSRPASSSLTHSVNGSRTASIQTSSRRARITVDPWLGISSSVEPVCGIDLGLPAAPVFPNERIDPVLMQSGGEADQARNAGANLQP